MCGKMGETCTGFWWQSLKEKDHLKDKGIDGRIWVGGGGCGVD
jgi:hypothetical protein